MSTPRSMRAASLLAAFTCFAATAAADTPEVTFQAPGIYIQGEPFMVQVELSVGDSASGLAPWLLQEAGFSIDGQPLGSREDDRLIPLPKGSQLSLEFDLAPFLGERQDFELTFAKNIAEGGPIQVKTYTPARADDGGALDFMSMEPEQLDDYLVVMQTNRGPMVAEFWPDVAPDHVRNFLDLSASGFYVDTLFHRVGRGFMIQGGDPYTKDPANMARWGQGNGPRSLQAEFNARKHVKGVLSMARGTDVNSASSQFFVMHGDNPGLDNQYSAFGQLLPDHRASFNTLDRIADSKGSPIDPGTLRPNEPQRILQTNVVLADAAQ